MTQINKNSDPSLLWQDPSQSSGSANADAVQNPSPQTTGQLTNYSPVAATGSTAPGAVDSTSRSGRVNTVTAGAQAFGHQNPILPDAKDALGKPAEFSPENRQRDLAMLQAQVPADGAHVSQAEIFNILDKTAESSFKLASKLQRASNQASIEAKEAEVKDQKAEIEGEKKSQATQLAGSILGALATGAMGIYGAKLSLGKASSGDKSIADAQQTKARTNHLVADEEQSSGGMMAVSRRAKSQADARQDEEQKSVDKAKTSTTKNAEENEPVQQTQPSSQDHTQGSESEVGKVQEKTRTGRLSKFLPENQAIGSGLQASANAAGQVINQSFSLVDKLAGGQHEADTAKVAQKVDQVMAQIAQANQESSKANRDQVTEFIKTIMQMVQSGTQRHQDMMNQIGNR